MPRLETKPGDAVPAPGGSGRQQTLIATGPAADALTMGPAASSAGVLCTDAAAALRGGQHPTGALPQEPLPAWLEETVLAAVPPLRWRQTVVSVDAEVYQPGTAISIDGRAPTMRRGAYLGFIDLAPGNSWPHDCLYVLCDAWRRTARVRRGRTPPRLGAGRRLQVIGRGEDVPPWGAAPPYQV